MSILTLALQKKFDEAQALSAELSAPDAIVFDHAMKVTALNCENNPQDIAVLENIVKQSAKHLTAAIKKTPAIKALIGTLIGQSDATPSRLVKGLESWTLSLLAPDKALQKTHNQ